MIRFLTMMLLVALPSFGHDVFIGGGKIKSYDPYYVKDIKVSYDVLLLQYYKDGYKVVYQITIPGDHSYIVLRKDGDYVTNN